MNIIDKWFWLMLLGIGIIVLVFYLADNYYIYLDIYNYFR